MGKWHLTAPGKGDHNYTLAQEAIQGCGFHSAEAIYPENMGESWADPAYNEGRNITHNMEHMVARAVEFMEDAIKVQRKPFFL